MAHFYHIYIVVKPGVQFEPVKKTMDLALDWFRCDSRNWIIYTTSDSKKWYSRLKQYIEPGGHLFICKLDTNDYWGLMSKKLWEWLKKPRQTSIPLK